MNYCVKGDEFHPTKLVGKFNWAIVNFIIEKKDTELE